MIHITLPLSVSVNAAYGNKKPRPGKKGGRYRTSAYRKFIKDATEVMDQYDVYEITGDEWLKVVYIVNIPLYTKDGKKRIVDVFNYEKTLSDFLAKKITGFEDHKILEGRVIKQNSDKNTIEVYIYETKESKKQEQELYKSDKKE